MPTAELRTRLVSSSGVSGCQNVAQLFSTFVCPVVSFSGYGFLRGDREPRMHQNRCSIFFQQGNILFMIYMNDKSSESLSADGHTQFSICLSQNN